MQTPITHARSLLFVPASRLARLGKAFDAGADAVIVDLEDAIAPEAKANARAALAAHLPYIEPERLRRLLVRINAVGTAWHMEDLSMVTAAGVGIMLPKAEDPNALRTVTERQGPGGILVALIESLLGLDHVDALAREAGVIRLAFGHLDFQLDMGMRSSPEEPELAFARNALVAASRRAGLPAPIDGVTTATDDNERLTKDAARARAFGFTGKLCIHPSQVDSVHGAFSPSEKDLTWARQVVEMAGRNGGQAFILDGRMVDLPVIRSAEILLLRRSVDCID